MSLVQVLKPQNNVANRNIGSGVRDISSPRLSLNPLTKTGFTIVELLIVIVVIGILAAISIVAYNGLQQRAKDGQKASDIAQIKKALLAYDAVHSGVVRPRSPGYTKPTDEPPYGGWDVSTI